MELPNWWIWASGIFFVLGSLLLIALIALVFFLIATVRSLSQRVTALTQRVETVSHKVEELVESAKEVTGKAKGVATTLSDVAAHSAQKIEIITTVLFALGAIGKMRRSFGGRKKR